MTGDARVDVSRAVVLGGGGVTGIAWELGVVASLAEEGIEIARADLIVGTSAGAAVAAQITSGAPLADLTAIQRAPHEDSKEIAVELDLEAMIAIFSVLGEGELPAEERRARVGAMALEAHTVPEAIRREVIAARLPGHDWPEHRLVLTAVDAHTGAFILLDRESGIPLVDAVAASCAVPGVWPPVSAGGRRFIDGGVRSATNVDVVAGHDIVLVLSPLSRSMAARLDREVTRLETEGARVVVIEADAAALAQMGDNPLDPAKRGPALDAGRRQGAAVAGEVRAVWDEV